MTLRERCEKLVKAIKYGTESHDYYVHKAEAFAREIRKETLEEAKTAIFKSEIPCIECSEIAENSVRALIRTTALAANAKED